MNQEKNQKNRSPHHDGGGLLAQVQASVEILSPVPVGGKCREKDYERLFIREPEVKAIRIYGKIAGCLETGWKSSNLNISLRGR